MIQKNKNYLDLYRSTGIVKKHCSNECHVLKKSCSPLPGKSLLKCARGSSGPLPAITTGTELRSQLLSNFIPVGSITIDTIELCNPTVLLSFNLIISIPVGATARLTFTVFKCCNGCTYPIGESTTFAVTPAILSSQSFSFQVCDCSKCYDCVTYSLRITNATLGALGTTITSNISALAVENICLNKNI